MSKVLAQTVEAEQAGVDAGPLRPTPSLAEIAAHIPLGWECRSCGASTYNALMRDHRYVTTGDTCCPNFREWIRLAQEGGPTVTEAHKAKMAARRSAVSS